MTSGYQLAFSSKNKKKKTIFKVQTSCFEFVFMSAVWNLEHIFPHGNNDINCG